MDAEPPLSNQETEPQLQPKVWCGALGAYNAGTLHGEWLHAAVEPDELWEGVNRVLRTSPEPHEEEFGWFDYEGFAGIRIGEYEPVERVTALGRLAVAHGEPFAFWLNHEDEQDLETAEERFQESYVGEFDSEEALADHLADEWGIEASLEEAVKSLSEWVRMYVKFDAGQWVRDLQYNGELFLYEDVGRVFAYFVR